jgi:ribosome-binding factor A
MSKDRLTRVNELLRREIGLALYHVMPDSVFDISAITVTHVQTSSNLRSARVSVSIRDHEQEREQMIGALRHRRAAIQAIISRNVVLKYTPKLEFVLDLSLEKGDHVLGLLHELDLEYDADAESDGGVMAPDDEADGEEGA